MKTLWSEDVRGELHARIDRLMPDMKPRWGAMTAREMVAHLVEGMRMGTGHFPTKPRRVFSRRWPFKPLFIWLIPMTKGIPAPARELLTRGREIDFDEARAEIHQLLDDFPHHDRAWPEHPYFGPMSGREWGRIGYKHADHHLRQFGV